MWDRDSIDGGIASCSQPRQGERGERGERERDERGERREGREGREGERERDVEVMPNSLFNFRD